MMSINDVPEVRALLKGCRIEEVSTIYSTASSVGGKKKVTELLIMNYVPRLSKGNKVQIKSNGI